MFGLQPSVPPSFSANSADSADSAKPIAVLSAPRLGLPRCPSRRRAHTLSWLTLVALATLSVAGSASAQSIGKTRRETSEVRRERIRKALEETYTHRWEAGGGGGYLRFRSGEFLQKNSEIAFWSSASYFFNPKLGVTGEVRGAYGNAKVYSNGVNLSFNPQISEYPFLAGPTYRLRNTVKTSVGIFALGGMALGKFDGGSKGFTSQDIHVWQSATQPAFSLGANFDWNLYPNLAVRIAPSYLGTFFRLAPLDPSPGSHGTIQSNVGFNVGIVYRFGHQKK